MEKNEPLVCLIIFALVLSSLFYFFHFASATTVFQDGFESGFSNWSQHGNVSISTTNPHSGTYCAKTGGVGNGYCDRNLGAEYNTLYVTAWVYLEQYPSPGSPDNQIFIVNTNSGNPYIAALGLYQDGSDYSWNLAYTTNLWNAPPSPKVSSQQKNPPLKTWISIGLLATANMTEFRAWVNGSELTDVHVTGANSTVTTANYVEFADTFFVQDYDDVVTSDSYGAVSNPPVISDFAALFSNNTSVRVIYPSNSTGKPLGCKAAMVSDWLASAFVSTKLTDFTEGLDTETDFVNQTNGKPVGASGTGIVSFGGPMVNLVVIYSESNSTTLSDRTPIKFHNDNGVLSFQYSNGSAILGATMQGGVVSTNQDMFVIETFRDGDGRYIMLCYGFGWQGTYAAGKYFDAAIYPNLNSQKESWIIVKWQDTNGNGFVNGPYDGDTYTTITQGN